MRLSSRRAGHHKAENDEKAPSLKKENVPPNTRAWSLSTHPRVSGNLSEAHTAAEPFGNFPAALYLLSAFLAVAAVSLR